MFGGLTSAKHQCGGFDHQAEVGQTFTCTCGKRFVAVQQVPRTVVGPNGAKFVTLFEPMALANA